MSAADPDAAECPKCGYALFLPVGFCSKCGDCSVGEARHRRAWDHAIEAGVLEDVGPDAVGFRSDAFGIEAMTWIRDALDHRIRLLKKDLDAQKGPGAESGANGGSDE